MRNIHKNVPVLFEPHDYTVVETDYNEQNNKNNETIFTVANGYIGLRGFFEEGFYGAKENSDPTTMINGVYEYFPYNHIWCRPGFPQRFHAIVGQTNPIDVKVLLDGEPVTLAYGVEGYSRTLDFRDGTVVRKFTFTAKNGKSADLIFERFASQYDKHLVFVKISVTAKNDCEVKFISSLKSLAISSGAVKEEIGGASGSVFENPEVYRKANLMQVSYSTIKSKFDITCAVADGVDCKSIREDCDRDNSLSSTYIVNAKSGEKIAYTRAIGYATMRDFANFKTELGKKVSIAYSEGYDKNLEKSKSELEKFWKVTDVEIDSDPLVQQGIRFSMFQIYQSTGKDGITNISANGLTGTGYSGHTFWDTEIFMMPMYIYTNPEIAKKLITYRYNILDNARERAKQMDDVGALFSWNSINGEECGHVFEAVTAQYHINNAVYYAIYRYYEATQDEKFLVETCAEILFEISKCMAHRGSFIKERDGEFCINVICGPDEYNPIVDNNLYTNLMTKRQLYFALEVAKLLKEKYPQKYLELVNKCNLDEKEFELWQRAADNMRLPYNKELDIYLQDDNFLFKDPIDLEAIPKERLPLLTNLHPLNLWRYQVIKQADIVLLTFLCCDAFTREMRKKIFDFYEPKTIHDSSLSAGIHSIVACDVGYEGEAYNYLKQSCRMDLDNVNRNTFFGLHAACMGTSWMMLVNGYGGLRIINGKLHFKPYCAENWNCYTFKIKFRGSVLSVKVSKDKTEYRVIEGDNITVFHKDNEIMVDAKGVIIG